MITNNDCLTSIRRNAVSNSNLITASCTCRAVTYNNTPNVPRSINTIAHNNAARCVLTCSAIA